jgi:hypothetical protein
MTDDRFFRTPSFDGTLYAECNYAATRLTENGRILAMTLEGLTYCPPLRTDYPLSAVVSERRDLTRPHDLAVWIAQAKTRKYDVVIARIGRDLRFTNEWMTAPVTDYGAGALDEPFRRAIDRLTPIMGFGLVQIFSGPDFMAQLEEIAAAPSR